MSGARCVPGRRARASHRPARPIVAGNVSALDLPACLAAHAAGRGARLMQVVGELGIGWQLARIWTGPRACERSLKQRGAPRRCPVCQLARLGLDTGRPADLFAFEVGPRAAGLEPPPELRP